MHAKSLKQTSYDSHYQLVAAALEFLHERARQQPSTSDIAGHLGISEGTLHRRFRQFVGLTPKQYLQTLTVAAAKQSLLSSKSVFDAALDAGLSGSGRLHDHFVTVEAVTPGEYRTNGEEITITHGEADSPFGKVFIATTTRGICQLSFQEQPYGENGLDKLVKRWPEAELIEDREFAVQSFKPVLDLLAGGQSSLRIHLCGSNFQIQVWRALLKIPTGSMVDYGSMASAIGKPRAVRAVATAIGANPIAMLIPCHRVIRSDGNLGGYHWGLPRKQMMLAKEINTCSQEQAPSI